MGDTANLVFQSTLPARGATFPKSKIQSNILISIHAPREGSDHSYITIGDSGRNFNPRSPRGERHYASNREQLLVKVVISIHAPREGSDLTNEGIFHKYRISIHAPREGSDDIIPTKAEKSRNFNPRSPRGERPSGS